MSSEKLVRTVCPRNCYCTCGMLVRVEGGRITSIEGDPHNSATGGNVCLKGLAYAERVRAPDRLTAPLRRSGNGSFQPVAWEEALDGIAEGLGGVRDRHGAGAVLYYEGSGSHGALSHMAETFLRPFGPVTRAHGDLCWPAGLEATRLTYGDNRHNHPRLTIQSRFLLLWGHNPAETNVHQWRLILDARDAGAQLAVIDPRSTDTTDAADIHLQPRPGTDATLALGMAHVLIEEGLYDEAFVARHGSGFDAYRERVRAWPPERAAKEAGVGKADLLRVARAWGRTRPAMLMAGFGLQRHHHAGQTMRAVCLIPALTGDVGVAGGGWQYANLASHCLVPPPLPDPPDPPGYSFPTSRLGRALGEDADPQLQAAWIEKANPASQHPRSDLVREGLERLDLVVVVDQFMTETARLADWVLPAKSLFEEEDLVTAYWHPYLQLRQKALDPPSGMRTETEIWRALCERFGFETRWFPDNEEEHRSLLRSMLPPDRPGLLEELLERPIDPSDNGEVAWVGGTFQTPDGRIAFASEEAARLWGVDPVPDYVPLSEGHASAAVRLYPLQLLTCKTRERIHSQFGNLSWIREVERSRRLDLSPDDAAARGVKEGDEVEVFNDRGRVVLRAHLQAGLRPGVAHIIEGMCTSSDPEINRLTDDGVTDMNHGATFYECLVEVRPI